MNSDPLTDSAVTVARSETVKNKLRFFMLCVFFLNDAYVCFLAVCALVPRSDNQN